MEFLNVENINEIWGYACSGEIENLKAYYENGGQKDARYYGCGKYHSLTKGASISCIPTASGVYLSRLPQNISKR